MQAIASRGAAEKSNQIILENLLLSCQAASGTVENRLIESS